MHPLNSSLSSHPCNALWSLWIRYFQSLPSFIQHSIYSFILYNRASAACCLSVHIGIMELMVWYTWWWKSDSKRFEISFWLAFTLLSTAQSELDGTFRSCHVQNQVWKQTEIKLKVHQKQGFWTSLLINGFVYEDNLELILRTCHKGQTGFITS